MATFGARAAAVLAGLLLTVGACAQGQDDGHDHDHGAASGPPHNAADVTFAQGMIPHHIQAVEMARQAASKAAAPRVRRLAARIEAAQEPEIDTMSDWLSDWHEAVPAASSSGHEGHGGEDMHGSMSGMDGMMSAQQMDRLEVATGARFDRLWLRMMVAHHTGAVAAARAEQSGGRFPDAVALAERIEASQSAEIRTMREWLTG